MKSETPRSFPLCYDPTSSDRPAARQSRSALAVFLTAILAPRAILFLDCAVWFTALAGCRQADATARPIASWLGTTMGTQYTVRIAEPPDGVGLPLLKHRITSRLDAINRQMSTYLPESEISRFNRVESPDWFPVSADVVRVVAAALEVSRSTAGAFDVTVGPLVNLWGFGPAGRSATVPAAEAVAACRSRVGYGLLQVRADPPALRKRRADVHVDLSAIAKGFAVDEVARILERHRVRGYLIEIGGEVRTCGRKSDGGLWRVGIERPVVDGRAIACVIELEGQSLATSGDYRNYFEQQGRRYSHAIDPRTGRPVEHGLVSVSVLASDCMTADAWATALMVLGPEAALPMARRHGLDVLCMIRTTAGVVERTTPGFAARITGSASSGGEPPIGAGSEARR